MLAGAGVSSSHVVLDLKVLSGDQSSLGRRHNLGDDSLKIDVDPLVVGVLHNNADRAIGGNNAIGFEQSTLQTL